VQRYVQAEARAAKTPEARTHAQLLLAEVHRLGLKEAEPARIALEQARPPEHDPRAALALLGLELAQSAREPVVSWGSAPSLAPLVRSVATLRRLRSEDAALPDAEPLPLLALADARRALARQETEAAVLALGRLEARPGLREAVLWLSATWYAANPATLPRALEALRGLARDANERGARRELAGLALELGDRAALAEALRAPTPGESPAFSALEVVSLQALAGEPPSPQAHEAISHEPSLGALHGALARLWGNSPAAPHSLAEARFNLGREAAHGRTWAELAASLPHVVPDPIWSPLLELERSYEVNDALGIARNLHAAAPRHKLGHAAARFIAGLLLETKVDAESARSEYEAAMTAGVAREAAARALCEGAGPAIVAQLLRVLAANAGDALSRALLLLEAAFQLPLDDPQLQELANEAVRLLPSLPFGYVLGEQAAIAKSDAARRLDWQRRRREAAEDPRELALDTIREAVALAALDRAGAAALLGPLRHERARDLSLHALAERFAPGNSAERARWRWQAAALVTGRERERLLAEAAFEFEHAQDLPAAAQAALELASPLGAVLAERLGTNPSALAARAERLAQEAEASDDIELKCDHYQRLTELELARGDAARALGWQRSILKYHPERLSALRFFERALMAQGPVANLEPVTAELALCLGPEHGKGHAYVAARLKLDRGAGADAQTLARLACSSEPAPGWAIRLTLDHAARSGDDHALLEACQALLPQAGHRLDQAALNLRAAEAALRLGRLATAQTLIDRAREVAPDHVVVLACRAEILKARGDHAQAAEAFEALASASQVPEQRWEALYQAGLLWRDVVQDAGRAERALLRAQNDGTQHPGIFDLLVKLYSEAEDHAGVLELASKRLELGGDPVATNQARVVMAEALLALKRDGEASSLLMRVLGEEPKNARALNSLGKLQILLKDWAAAERSLRTALEYSEDDASRLRALRGLARLHERELTDPALALRDYREIIELDPHDRASFRRLTKIATSAGHPGLAVEIQSERVEQAKNDQERQRAMLELVELHEKSTGDRNAARELLEQARRAWPDDAGVLSAEIGFFHRAGDRVALQQVVERALSAARAGIAAGRLTPALFRSLRVASRFSAHPEVARSTQAILNALNGQNARWQGAGSRAGQPSFDDLVAPAELFTPLRELLYRQGAAIDRAFAPPLERLEARPLPADLAAQVHAVASAFGELSDVQVLVSARLGSVCIPLGHSPAYVVFGDRLLSHASPRVRDFLLLRALKIAQVHAGALCQMSDADLASTLAGLLACYDESWRPPGIDAERLRWVREHIRPHLREDAMSAELAASLVPRFDPNTQYRNAFGRWGSRVALLGVGDPGVALESLWTTIELTSELPNTFQARARWITSQDEARDLVSFALSDAYVEARRKAGLGRRSG
jgi:cellulose synthase operon protein C